jgi:signal transduction histidine kinase
MSGMTGGLRFPRRTVRLRFTLLYAGLFLVSAAGLLAITYLLVARQLPSSLSLYTHSSGGTLIGGSAPPVVCPGQAAGPPPPQDMLSCMNLLVQQNNALRADTLDKLLLESGIAFGIMAIASVGLGWLMAGRVLRPLRTITATARRVSARNLHQRIAMTGPDDELKELGDTFDQLLGRLEASFRAQRQFVANASHELRTPLARQRTLLEVALRGRHGSHESLRTACERALVANEQHERLIAAMLTLARSERGLDRFDPFDLGEIAEEALVSSQAGPELHIVADLNPAPALGDTDLAGRLVANLIDNAVRYNIPGGQLEIATGMRGDSPFIAVANTGPHVPPDQLGRLFLPFERMDGRRAGEAAGGLGLGLAIVAAITTAHGAELHAQPGEQGGLAIEILFAPRETSSADLTGATYRPGPSFRPGAASDTGPLYAAAASSSDRSASCHATRWVSTSSPTPAFAACSPASRPDRCTPAGFPGPSRNDASHSSRSAPSANVTSSADSPVSAE